MNRADLQQLAEARLREAKVLFDAGEWSGSYYLCGYSVECALKAVVAAQVNQGDFPDKKLADAVYTHDLVKLRGLGARGRCRTRTAHRSPECELASSQGLARDSAL